jgi:hypothetical protein
MDKERNHTITTHRVIPKQMTHVASTLTLIVFPREFCNTATVYDCAYALSGRRKNRLRKSYSSALGTLGYLHLTQYMSAG